MISLMDRWAWIHTMILLIVSVIMTSVVYSLTGIFLFIILFVPPLFAYKKSKE